MSFPKISHDKLNPTEALKEPRLFHRKLSKEHADLSLAYPANPRQLHEAARAYSNPRQTKSPSSAQVRRRIKNAQKFATDTSLSKVLPTTIMQPDQERLREEGRSLKLENNSFREENIRLRTKINQLDKELAKRDEVLDELRGAAGERHYFVAVKQVHLVTSLKQTVKDMRNELKAREEEVAKMKKTTKFTQVSELEAEIDAYIEECSRLKKLVLDSARPISRSRLVNSIDQAQGQMITKLNKEKLLLERNLQNLKEEVERMREKERSSREMPMELAAEVAKVREDLSSKGKTLSQTEEKVRQLTILLKSAQENAQQIALDREKWKRKYEESFEETRELRSRLVEIEAREAQTALQFIVTKLASKSVSFLSILQRFASNGRFQDLIEQVEATRVVIPEHYWQSICPLYITNTGSLALTKLINDVEPLKPRLRDSSLLFLGKKEVQRRSSGSELLSDSPEPAKSGTSREEKAICGRYQEESDEIDSDLGGENEGIGMREEGEYVEKKGSMTKKPNLQVEVIEYEASEKGDQSPPSIPPYSEALIPSKSDLPLPHIPSNPRTTIKKDSIPSSNGQNQSESLPQSSRLSSGVYSDKPAILSSEDNPFRIEESVGKVEELVSEKPESYAESQDSEVEYEKDLFEAEELPLRPESPVLLYPADEELAITTELQVSFPHTSPPVLAETGSVSSPVQTCFPVPEEPLTVKSFEDLMNRQFQLEGSEQRQESSGDMEEYRQESEGIEGNKEEMGEYREESEGIEENKEEIDENKEEIGENRKESEGIEGEKEKIGEYREEIVGIEERKEENKEEIGEYREEIEGIEGEKEKIGEYREEIGESSEATEKSMEETGKSRGESDKSREEMRSNSQEDSHASSQADQSSQPPAVVYEEAQKADIEENLLDEIGKREEESILDFAPPEEPHSSEGDLPFTSRLEEQKDSIPSSAPFIPNPVAISSPLEPLETLKKSEIDVIDSGKVSQSQAESPIFSSKSPESSVSEGENKEEIGRFEANPVENEIPSDLDPKEEGSDILSLGNEVEKKSEVGKTEGIEPFAGESDSRPIDQESESSEEHYFESEKAAISAYIAPEPEPATELSPQLPQNEVISVEKTEIPISLPQEMPETEQFEGILELFQSFNELKELEEGFIAPFEQIVALETGNPAEIRQLEENYPCDTAEIDEKREETAVIFSHRIPPESPQPQESPFFPHFPIENQAKEEESLSEAQPCESPKSSCSSSEALEAKTKAYIKAIALALTAQDKSLREVFEETAGKISSADFLYGLRELGLADLPPSDFQLLILSLSTGDSGEIDIGELEELFALQGVQPRPAVHSSMSSLSGIQASRSLTPNPERAFVQEIPPAEVIASSAEESQNSFYEYAGEAGKCPDRLT